jgi:hypothetical protein
MVTINTLCFQESTAASSASLFADNDPTLLCYATHSLRSQTNSPCHSTMEVATPGQGANGHAPSTPSPATIDPDLVVRHLVDLLEVTLGASSEELEGKGSILSEARRSDTVQRCTRFASESQVAIYVQKTVVSPDMPNGVSNGHVSLGMPRTQIPEDALLISTLRALCPLRLLSLKRNIILAYDGCFGCPDQTTTTDRSTNTPPNTDTGHQSAWDSNFER